MRLLGSGRLDKKFVILDVTLMTYPKAPALILCLTASQDTVYKHHVGRRQHHRIKPFLADVQITVHIISIHLFVINKEILSPLQRKLAHLFLGVVCDHIIIKNNGSVLVPADLTRNGESHMQSWKIISPLKPDSDPAKTM